MRGLERQRILERIELGPLLVEATVQLLREVVREDVRQLGQQLHAETEGNPLFAVETIRSLLESGKLQLGIAARPGPTPLPDSVQAAIRGRLARLDPDAAGSVIHEYVGLVYLGLPEARLGDAAAGASALEKANAIAQAAGTMVLLGRAHGWLAEVELARDQPDEALRLADAGQEVSTRHAYLYDAAWCERARGEALGTLGDRHSAMQALERAVAQFAAIGAKPEVTRTQDGIAALG